MAITAGNKNLKSKELILYISSRLKDKHNYGSTLLNKSLYFIDSMSYLKKGMPISHFEYIKQKFGPTPKPAQFLQIKDELITKKEMDVVDVNYFGREQKKFRALREPDMSVFSSDEINIINSVLDSICDTNAVDISEYSHKFIAWQFASEKESLPYYTFLLSNKEPEPQDHEWAKRSMERYKQSKGL
jgi:hypothetical protein